MKLDTNFIYIAGYAGHGKDTVKAFIKEKYDHEYYDITMAETLKSNACALIKDEHLNMTQSETALEALNKLKDNYPDYQLFAGMNTRLLLQKLGTDYYRSMHSDIHTDFVAVKILNILDNSQRKDILFTAGDIRFPNELNLMLECSQLKDDDLKDYLRYRLSKGIALLPSTDVIVKKFEDVFPSTPTERKHFLESILQSVDNMKDTKQYQKEWNVELPVTGNIPKEEAIKYGFMHIFRPILNPENKLSNNLSTSKLIEEIKNYTSLNVQKILDIVKYYKISEIDFNAENINKYGYLRADVRHLSETAVNHLKPEAVMSTPLKDGKFKASINSLLQTIEVKEEQNLELKKNNSYKRKI